MVKTDITTIRRASGSVEVYSEKTGKPVLVSERDPSGRSVARIIIKPSKSGKGIVSSRPVRSPSEVVMSKEVNRVQENINKASAVARVKPVRVIGVVDPKTKRLSNIKLLTSKGKVTNIGAYKTFLTEKVLSNFQKDEELARKRFDKFVKDVGVMSIISGGTSVSIGLLEAKPEVKKKLKSVFDLISREESILLSKLNRIPILKGVDKNKLLGKIRGIKKKVKGFLEVAEKEQSKRLRTGLNQKLNKINLEISRLQKKASLTKFEKRTLDSLKASKVYYINVGKDVTKSRVDNFYRRLSRSIGLGISEAHLGFRGFVMSKPNFKQLVNKVGFDTIEGAVALYTLGKAITKFTVRPTVEKKAIIKSVFNKIKTTSNKKEKAIVGIVGLTALILLRRLKAKRFNKLVNAEASKDKALMRLLKRKGFNSIDDYIKGKKFKISKKKVVKVKGKVSKKVSTKTKAKPSKLEKKVTVARKKAKRKLLKKKAVRKLFDDDDDDGKKKSKSAKEKKLKELKRKAQLKREIRIRDRKRRLELKKKKQLELKKKQVEKRLERKKELDFEKKLDNDIALTLPELRKLKKKLKKGEKVAYNLKVLKKGRIVILKLRLPINRAKEKIIRLINRGVISRGKVVAVGKTRKKDITSVALKKVKLKKKIKR